MKNSFIKFRWIIFSSVLLIFSYLCFSRAPVWLFSESGLKVEVILLIQTLAICWVYIHSQTQQNDPNRTEINIVMTLWWFLSIAEEYFRRFNPTELALEDSFPISAYGEAIFWGFSLAITCIIFILFPNRSRLLELKAAKWLVLLCLVSLFSCVYSTNPSYSLAWSLKFLLTLMLLLLFFARCQSTNDLWSFIKVNFSVYLLLTIAPILRIFANPSTAFESGRLTIFLAPIALSQRASFALLLAITLWVQGKDRKYLFSIVFLAGALFFGGGKIAIIAALLGSAAFFLLQRKVGSGILFFLMVVPIFMLIIQLTPLGQYFSDYAASGQISTLTGRTDLWKDSIKLIQQKPLQGYGYCASKFISAYLGKKYYFAAHLHNSFLEALYNNGVLGLFVYLVLIYMTIRSLMSVLFQPKTLEINNLTTGFFGVFLVLFTNSFFEATFGGRVTAPTPLFFVTVLLAQYLQKELANQHPIA
jgi:O-antigen ligase